MSDVVLIVPRYDMHNIMTANRENIDKPITNLQLPPSLGVAYLAGSLEKNNFNTKIIDIGANSLTQNDVIKILEQEKPIIIGIYVNSFSLHSTYLLIKKIKKFIKTKVIVGGIHITHNPESVIYLNADYGFRGEGDINFPLIVKALKEKKEPKNICGLIKIKKNKIFCNGVAEIKNLNLLPFPARHLLPNEKYYVPYGQGKITIMITSRGCLFNCIFCSLHSKKIRVRSPENIVKEMQYLANECFNFISIEDDFFTFDQGRVKEICELIIKKNIKIEWCCGTRADFVNLDLLKLMKKAGCSLIGFGIESGSENIRNNIIGKYIRDDKIIAAFKNAKKAKIRALALCMFGFPGETLKDMEKTLGFVLKLDPDYADFTLSSIIPGSKLFNIALKEGKINKDIWIDVIKNNKPIPIYIPDGLTLEDLKRIQKKSFLTFYFRPKRIMYELKNLKKPSEIILKLKLVFRLINYFKNENSSN